MEENQKPQITNYGNYSDSKGWFNRTKQTIGEGESKTSFGKVVAGVIAALAGIGGIIVALIKTGILSVNV